MSGMRQETKERYDTIYRLYLEGKSRKEISTETSSAYSTIDRALRANGVKRISFKEKEGEILAMRRDGMTLQEISDETGLDVKTISTNLHSRGIEGGSRAVKKKRKNEVHREKAEDQEAEAAPRQYAEDRRRKRQVTAGGKTYTDITDWYM